MRVYLPATTAMLRVLLDAGSVGPPPLIAFAVTPGLREWYVDEDDEALEYAAMSEAARVSLRLIDQDGRAAHRRVVLAVDVADAVVAVHDDIDRGVVKLAEPVRLATVASAHVDDADAEETVRLAAGAMVAADLGDDGSQELVDDAEGFELSWYANQELEHLLDSL